MSLYNRKKREPINFDEFKYPEPAKEEPEEEEPKERADCCDRCLFSLFGCLLLYCGILVVFFSERDHKYSQRDISYIKSNLQLLDISTQNPSEINTLLETAIENTYPIHFIDNISNLNEKNMIVMDDRSDLSYPGIALKINTEMYQWVEEKETMRKEGSTQANVKYTYNKQWANTFHDSSEFNEKDEYYNPQPTVSKLAVRNMWVDQIIIGQNKNVQFYLSKSLYTKLSQRNLWKNVTQKSAEYSDRDGNVGNERWIVLLTFIFYTFTFIFIFFLCFVLLFLLFCEHIFDLSFALSIFCLVCYAFECILCLFMHIKSIQP